MFKSIKGFGLGALIFIGALIVGFISLNNSIQRTSNEVDQAWADVQAQYQRRLDLIPNLVKTVKAAAVREQETLTKVINARNIATKAQQTATDPNELQAAQNNLTRSINNLLLVVERYPELRSQQGFLNFQTQYEGTENRIRAARSDYNAAVRKYNDKVTTFPGSLLKKPKKDMFKSDVGAEKAPTVDFDN